MIVDQLHPLVVGAPKVGEDEVEVFVEWREGEVVFINEHLVSIDEEQVVALSLSRFQRLVAIIFEVLPGALMQLARDILHMLLDDLLRAVGGSGVADHPIVDDRLDRIEAAADHGALIFYNHVETDGFILFGSEKLDADEQQEEGERFHGSLS